MGQGNSTNKPTPSDVRNFESLINCLSNNPKNILSLIENGSQFNFKVDGLTFFHYLVPYSFLFSRTDLQLLCDKIYEYRYKFGDIEEISSDKFLMLDISEKLKDKIPIMITKEKKYSFELIWMDNGNYWKNHSNDNYTRHTTNNIVWYEYRNFFNVINITPLCFCLYLKTHFIPMYKLEDNLDVLIELFNKLSPKDPKSNPLKCVLCLIANKDQIIKPCMRACICFNCAKSRTTCPICNGLIVTSDKFIL